MAATHYLVTIETDGELPRAGLKMLCHALLSATIGGLVDEEFKLEARIESVTVKMAEEQAEARWENMPA